MCLFACDKYILLYVSLYVCVLVCVNIYMCMCVVTEVEVIEHITVLRQFRPAILALFSCGLCTVCVCVCVCVCVLECLVTSVA